VLAAVRHVVRRAFFLPGIGGRDPQPGFGQQGLHPDWNSPLEERGAAVATAIALLDPFTATNGATRVVPGSHRARSLPSRETSAPTFVHPREVAVVAPAGAVLCFNGHLLHSGTRHRSSGPRRTVQCAYAAVEHRRRFPASQAAPAAS
jgi:ectoine hydroxylase-related dioxygenase (phytanoyl-CoA dioxygenase family)